jgi:uncharacterized protein
VSLASALYVGRVTHHRLRPRRHSLAYRAYWLLLDLDELSTLSARLRLFSHNRFNLFSFHDSEYGTGEGHVVRAEIERHLASAGIDVEGGRILLLAMPRILGYAFNPLSVYFCYARDGALKALVYEVHNTFQERHSYLIAVADQAAVVRQQCHKRFYVSPFLDMEMRYDFQVAGPDDAVSVVVRGSDGDGDLIAAALHGRRRPLTDANLARVFLTHPLLTAKVTIAIHYEALRLWLKGLRPRPKPAAPTDPVTIAAETRPLRRAS